MQSIGPYLLTRRLTEGGMGQLYIGGLRGDDDGVEVAIKVVDASYGTNADYVRAFHREADLAERIDHPNIVQVLNRGEDHGRQFLVMELLHGRSLAEVFARGRAADQWIPPDLAVSIAARIADALDHVHGLRDDAGRPLGMVHGDVSPQNIFITRAGEVKLIDFGLAHSALAVSGNNSPAKVYGKVNYLSPEQCSGKPADGRSDIFALGAVLYEGLTAHSPFSAASKFLVLMRISQGQPDPIRTHLPDISTDLEGVVNRALASDPEQRFVDADAMLAALNAHLTARGAEVGGRQLAAYLSKLFGDAVDAAAQATPLARGTAGRNTSDEIDAYARAMRPWPYLAVGAAVGVVAALLWILLGG